jgi:hypothetical protein
LNFTGWIFLLQRSEKAIAFSDIGFYESRLTRVVSQCRADLTNSGVDAALRIQKRLVAPESGDNLFTNDKFPSVFQQQKKKLDRNALEFDRAASTPQLIALSIRLKVCKAENVIQMDNPFLTVLDRNLVAVPQKRDR